MTYNVFGGTLSLTQPINHSEKHEAEFTKYHKIPELFSNCSVCIVCMEIL